MKKSLVFVVLACAFICSSGFAQSSPCKKSDIKLVVGERLPKPKAILAVHYISANDSYLSIDDLPEKEVEKVRNLAKKFSACGAFFDLKSLGRDEYKHHLIGSVLDESKQLSPDFVAVYILKDAHDFSLYLPKGHSH